MHLLRQGEATLAMNGSATRLAQLRAEEERAARVRREERCPGHDWRYSEDQGLPGYRPRRTCRLCQRVEWLTTKGEWR